MPTRPVHASFWSRLVPLWIALAALSSGIILFAYAAVQQEYRHGADDPQIQIAEDTAASLRSGRTASEVVPAGRVDIGASLAPFVIILNQACNVEAANGFLGGGVPTPPVGSLQYAAAHGRDRFTWEPQNGVREAAIIVPYHNASGSGYVLAARSLQEVEGRESQLTQMAAIAWLGAIVVSLIAAVTIMRAVRRQ